MTGILKLILQVLFFPFAVAIKAFKSKRNILFRILAIFVSIFALLPVWLLVVLIFGIVIATNVGFSTSPFSITGKSMLPTLSDGRILWTFPVKSWLKNYKPQRGDIVIVKSAKTLHNGIESDYVKRIIAIGGDELKIENGSVYLNGQLLDEPYLATKSSTWIPKKYSGDFKIPDGYVFLMGDNRVWSNDSRSIGFISTIDIVSYFPLSAQKSFK